MEIASHRGSLYPFSWGQQRSEPRAADNNNNNTPEGYSQVPTVQRRPRPAEVPGHSAAQMVDGGRGRAETGAALHPPARRECD